MSSPVGASLLATPDQGEQRDNPRARTRAGPTRRHPLSATPASGAGEAPRRDPLSRLRGLWEGVLSEINKVTWPTRTETRNLTIVVIGISVLIGGLLGIVDLILVAAIRVLTA